MISNMAASITRYEGKKFLKLREEIDDSLITEMALGKGADISLYIHIPFCRTLCPFCCFNRYLFKEDRAREYFRNLKKELDLYIQKGFDFSNFYFGGGTPTILMDELLIFIDYLRDKFDIKEMSLETTPREITEENIKLLKDAGINRLSIGVQSFDDEILNAMGRLLCTGEEAKKKLLMAQGQFDTLNLDLIFNFPFQTVEKFESDVATFKNLSIDQVTFYPLMPSPHKKDALERRFTSVDNSRERKYYDVIIRDIYNQGYKASTVWCFSRGDKMIDEYIVDFADYIGIGSGSVSLARGNFYVNSFSLDRYNDLIEHNRLPIVRWRRLSEREYLRYYLLTKLFGMKLDMSQFQRDFNADAHSKLWSELLMLKLAGIVKEDDGINVTQRGMYSVSAMMREFFASLNSLREYCIDNQI